MKEVTNCSSLIQLRRATGWPILPGRAHLWLCEDGWPTLGEAFQETENWYWQNREELPSPDSYPQLGLRG